MKRFLRHLLWDGVLWALLAACFFQLPYSGYAENVLSFLGIFLLVLAVFCLFAVDKVAKSIGEEAGYKPRGKVYKTYMFITTVAEVAVVAALGWYWVAAGFALYAIVMTAVRTEADKHYVPTH
jgi:hypothetical protein